MAFFIIDTGLASRARIAGNFLVLAGIFFCSDLLAQNDEAAAIRIGETGFTPAVRIEFGQSDNVLRRDIDQLEETFTIVQPELLWFADKGVTFIDAGYRGGYKISDESVADFDDHFFFGGFRTEFSKRSSFQASAQISFEHLEIGQDVFTRDDPLLFDQVEFVRQRIDLMHRFGANRAKGQLITRFRIDNLDYTNNDEVTQNSGRFLFGPSLTFSYRLSGDTRAFASASLTEIVRAGDGTDRTDLDFSMGASWAITGRTGGSASVGVGQAELDNRQDATELTARIGLFYLPRSFSKFELNFEREFFNDGSGTLTEAVILNQLDVVWRYDWSSRLFHRAEFSLVNVERSCPEAGDQTTEFSLEAGVNIRRWLSLGIGGQFESRENDNCSGMFTNLIEAPDFDRQELFAFVRFSL